MVIKIVQQEEKEMYCDNCGKLYEIDAVEIQFWYGSKYDFERKNFCSDKCCYEWITKNLK